MSEIVESDRPAEGPHPRERDGIVGHSDAQAMFERAVRSGHLPHAWLIGGPKGVGKATLAYRFARALIRYGDALPPTGLAVPPDDPVFRRVAAQSHGDLVVLRREWDPDRKRVRTEIRVDEVRKLAPFFGRHAGDGFFRVCIVDTADDLNENAANALLKLLEEPPARSLFLLLSDSPGRLLPTIRSRCRRLALRPLNEAVLGEALAAFLPDAPAERRRLAASLAGGSFGRALELAGEEGSALYGELARILSTLPKLDVAQVHALADKVGKAGADLAWASTIELMKSLVAAVATGESRDESLERLSHLADRARWRDLWDILHDAARRVDDLYFDKRQALLIVFDAAARAMRAA